MSTFDQGFRSINPSVSTITGLGNSAMTASTAPFDIHGPSASGWSACSSPASAARGG
jgi:hypothetical protein